jgi:hypothetical protein
LAAEAELQIEFRYTRHVMKFAQHGAERQLFDFDENRESSGHRLIILCVDQGSVSAM